MASARKPTTGRKPKTPVGLRQRARSDGSIRVWWEPTPEARKLGFAVVDLDFNRMSWSRDQATKLNKQVVEAQAKGGKATQKARRASRTIDDLIADYKASPHFQANLAEKTRTSYGVLMLQVSDKWGAYRAIDFDKATMKAWYQTLFNSKGTRMAQALIRMMSILFSHAEELEWRPENTNPCYRLKVVTPDPRSRAGAEQELAALLDGADKLGLKAMGLAIRLAIYQGQRQTDIRLAKRGAFTLQPWQASKVWVWKLRRQKRGNDGVMMVNPALVPQLRAVLADTSHGGQPQDLLLIDEATGQPYSETLFNVRWRAVRDWAADPEKGNCPGIASLQFRDLRRTFGVLARAGGASRDDVGDVLGNSAAVNPLLGETYMPASFETASRAIAAVKAPKAGRKKG